MSETPQTQRAPESSGPHALRGAELARAMGLSLELLDEAREGLLRVAAALHGQRGVWSGEFGPHVPEMAVHHEVFHDDTGLHDFGSWERAWDEARSEAFGG